jgi:hypothetical protein
MKRKLAVGFAAFVVAGVAASWMFGPVPRESRVSDRVGNDPDSIEHIPHEARPMIANPQMPRVLIYTQNISSVMRELLDSTGNPRKRIGLTAVLSTNLSELDWTALRSYLSQDDPADATQLGRVLKNNILNVLGRMEPPPKGLDDLLIQMCQDRTQDPVIRDYAFQHLAEYCELRAVLGDSESIRLAAPVFWDALSETESSIAGTSLLGLERLSRASDSLDQDKLGKAAIRLAKDARAGELTTISAFQVCARLGVQDAAALIRDAAENGATMPVRISAVACLGSLGDAQDMGKLQAIVNGRQPRLLLAAQKAIKQIQNREANSTTKNQRRN